MHCTIFMRTLFVIFSIILPSRSSSISIYRSPSFLRLIKFMSQSPITPTLSTNSANSNNGRKRKPTQKIVESKIESGDDEPSTKLMKITSIIPRDLVEPKKFSNSESQFRIMSWNVNGFSAMTKKLPLFIALIERYKPDVLCLQETKLQSNAVTEYKDILPDYKSYWHCSTVKKGYSGTAVFIRKDIEINATNGFLSTNSMKSETDETKAVVGKTKKQSKLSSMWAKKEIDDVEKIEEPNGSSSSTENVLLNRKREGIKVEKISYDFEDQGPSPFIGEGRTITVEFDKFFFICCYVPNSGEGLVRLDYRVNEWDPHMRSYLQSLSVRKPLIFAGDLNVGHLDADIHNPAAKHISKQAGLTPRERESFSQLLATPSSSVHSNQSFVDAFRFFHPDAKGQFTYWSQRTFARKDNRGLRLDYFICSGELFSKDNSKSDNEGEEVFSGPRVVDSFIAHEDTVGCSDHCPIVLTLQI